MWLRDRAGRHRYVALLVFGVIVLFLIVIVRSTQSVRLQSNHGRITGQSSLSARDLPVIVHLQAPQRKSFKIFRTDPEGLPPFIASILGKPIYGLNWSLAQRLPVNGQAAIWAVPGNRSICLVTSQKLEHKLAGVTCGTTRKTLRHGLFVALLSPTETGAAHQRLIIGIAPDSAHTVLVHTGAITALAPVTHGVFVRRDRANNPPDEVTLPRVRRERTG
jgi:hypothetical protein